MPDPLVLLPGMACSDRLWSEVAPMLAEVDVVRGHLPGSSLAECVHALLAELPPRFALAGLSLGGIVAMALTRTAPQRVSRLCLMSTNPKGPTEVQQATWAAQLAELENGRAPEQLQEDLLPLLIRRECMDELAADVVAMAVDVGAQGFADQLRLQTTRVDERPGLADIVVPTLVLAAERDALCPVAFHEDLHERISGSTLTVLPETGHLSPMERPREVARAMRSWLELVD